MSTIPGYAMRPRVAAANGPLGAMECSFFSLADVKTWDPMLVWLCTRHQGSHHMSACHQALAGVLAISHQQCRIIRAPGLRQRSRAVSDLFIGARISADRMLDTPSYITQLTTYGIQPTNVVYINARAKPSPSTVAAAVSVTATEKPSPTPTGGDVANDTAIAHNTGLSTAAKAGIGAGVGGGALVIALVVLAVLLYRKRRPKPQPVQNDPIPYSIGPPMQTTPYSSQAEKDPWHAAAYSAGSSPPILSPHFEPTYQTQYSHVVPSLYSEQRSAKAPSISPPTELSAERHVHELQSDQPSKGSDVSPVSSDKK